MPLHALKLLIFSLFFIPSCYYFASDYDQMLAQLYAESVPLILADSLAEMQQSDSPSLIFDTRSKKEFEVSHLPNAVHIDYDNFNLNEFDDISHEQTIILYCSVGYRSERIGEKLIKAGYKRVYNLYGGIFQWVNEERTIVNTQNQVTKNVHPYNKNWGKWLEKGNKVYE